MFWPTNRPSLVRLRAFTALMLATMASAGCMHAPGMRLDTASPELLARAELITLDPEAVQRLQGEARARAAQAQAIPDAFMAKGAFEYRVAPQDVLRITVWNHPELTNPSNTNTEIAGRIVNADGSVFFPFVGSFTAGGRTIGEIRLEVTRGLARVIKQPQVEVAVLQFRGQRVYVSGEVRTPGSIAITDVPPDLTEIIARAGGATADADLSAVTVTRGADQVRLDLQALYYAGDGRVNVRLRHGDIVNLPERRGAKVFVTGEVQRPVALLLPRGAFSLADALSDAGGLNPLSANAGQVFVLRAGANAEARARIYHLNAASPDALLLADQFILNSRDVVYVDTAPVVRWARVLNNLLPSVSAAREIVNDTTRAFPR